MGGGSETSNKFEPPEWSAQYYPGAMDFAAQLVSQPYSQYQGQKIAEVNPWQHGAGQLTVDRALYGDPQLNAARGSLMSISQGGAQNPFTGQMAGLGSAALANPYMGNAYTEQMIANTAGNMASGFAKGQAANTDAMAARSGAFGGSAHLEKQRDDASALAQQIAQMGTSTRQAQQNTDAGLFQQGIGQAMQGFGNAGSMWDRDVGNVLQAAGLSPQFSMLDQSSFDSMKQYGDWLQNYQQGLMSEHFGEFERQRKHPYEQLSYLLGALGQGAGQYGQSTQTSPGASPLAYAGGAMGLAGLLGSF